jgi:hypothetical protein
MQNQTRKDNYSYKSKTRIHAIAMMTKQSELTNARFVLTDAAILTFLPHYYLKTTFSRTHWLGCKVVPRIIKQKSGESKTPNKPSTNKKVQSSDQRSNTERREGATRWCASLYSFFVSSFISFFPFLPHVS